MLQTQQQMRKKGTQRTQNFNSMRSSGGARMRGGGRRRQAAMWELDVPATESYAG